MSAYDRPVMERFAAGPVRRVGGYALRSALGYAANQSSGDNPADLSQA
jgi:hypothetical protein